MVCGAGIGVFLMLRVSILCELLPYYFAVVLNNLEQRKSQSMYSTVILNYVP